MEIKKVFARKMDGVKFIVIPKGSDIQEGDYVKLVKVEEEINKKV